VILPSLAGVSGSDYRNNEAIARVGYEAAAAQAGFLRRFALDEGAWQEHLAARQARRRPVPARSAFVEVTGVPDRQADRLRRVLERRVGGSLDPGTIEAALTEWSARVTTPRPRTAWRSGTGPRGCS